VLPPRCDPPTQNLELLHRVVASLMASHPRIAFSLATVILELAPLATVGLNFRTSREGRPQFEKFLRPHPEFVNLSSADHPRVLLPLPPPPASSFLFLVSMIFRSCGEERTGLPSSTDWQRSLLVSSLSVLNNCPILQGELSLNFFPLRTDGDFILLDGFFCQPFKWGLEPPRSFSGPSFRPNVEISEVFLSALNSPLGARPFFSFPFHNPRSPKHPFH